MSSWAVTVNAGGAFSSPAVQDGMLHWARWAVAKQPAFAFVQEVPSDAWLSVWAGAGYQAVLGLERGWAVSSAILVRSDLEVEPLTTRRALTADVPPTLRYHGSYVAVARWSSARGPVVLASVHASPNEAEPSKYGWDGPDVTPRDGGGDPRYPGQRLWDSDLLLCTLASLADRSCVLAAGDFNEARNFDLDDSGQRIGTWGQEYFQRVSENKLTSWLYDQWREERPTHAKLQLDHLLISAAATDLLDGTRQPHLDSAWTAPPKPGRRGDHAPIWFALNPEWIHG